MASRTNQTLSPEAAVGPKTRAQSAEHGTGRNLAPSSVWRWKLLRSGGAQTESKLFFFQGREACFSKILDSAPGPGMGGLAQSRFVVNRGSKILYLIKRDSSAVDK